MMEIDDLQASSDLPLAPLSIKDPRDYFDSQQAIALKTSRDTSIGTDPVLSVLTHNISSTKYDPGKNPGLSVLDTLPDTIKEELLYASSCNLYGSCFRGIK
ncbi:hypothetical protein OIU85_019396 [Salix viminalis]|uniref:Uncharacterized protein n=1 Tax=Salix viminalis TaxID=40686 RepID=A0A9Q0ZJW9_SALVM|nr:hypothetical protein OIU85_019396 [Salix viminalis]